MFISNDVIDAGLETRQKNSVARYALRAFVFVLRDIDQRLNRWDRFDWNRMQPQFEENAKTLQFVWSETCGAHF